MKTSSVLLAALVLLLCGCAASSNGQDSKTDDDTADVDDDAIDDDTTPDDDTTADDDADDDATWGPYDFQFGDDPLGDLPAPWLVDTYGTTTFQVVKSPVPDLFFPPNGNVLEVNGGWMTDDYGAATLALPADVTGDIVVTLIFAVDDAKWLTFMVAGRQAHQAALQLDIFERKIMASGPQFRFECASITPNTREQVEIHISTAGTYDVLLDGQETACIGIESPGWSGDGYSTLSVYDDGSVDSGGVAYFADFIVLPWRH